MIFSICNIASVACRTRSSASFTFCPSFSLFVMAVHTASGTILPGNLTIIPSEQKWVFHAIYHLGFLEFYSTEVCSWNCVVITDEDKADYRSFESLIQMSEVFSRSSVMLCTFYGIWMAFKKDLISLLDECENGKKPWYVECSMFNFMCTNRFFSFTLGLYVLICTNFFDISTGDWLCKLFMHQACVLRTNTNTHSCHHWRIPKRSNQFSFEWSLWSISSETEQQTALSSLLDQENNFQLLWYNDYISGRIV